MARQNFTARRGSRHDIGTKPEKRARVRRPQPSSRATYADLLTIGALFIAIILVVTLGFQWALPS